MDILRKQYSSTGAADSKLSMTDEPNDMLIKLYQHVTQGPKSLISALQNLFGAQYASIEFLSSTNTPLNENICLLETSGNQHFGAFILENDIAILPFNCEQGYSLSFQLKFLNTQSCLQALVDDKVVAISSHIKQALAMCIDLSQQKQDLESTQYVLEKYPLPICIVDNHLNNIFTNEAFEKHLSENQHFPQTSSLKKFKALARSDTNLLSYCEDEKEKLKLKTALKELSISQEEKSHYLKLLINETETPIIITTSGYVPNVFRHYARDNLVWIHLLNNDYSQALKNNERFQGLGLSKTEQELSTLLFQGQSLNEISNARKVSKQTVRKQLQSTLRKTNCECQEDLIKFLFQHCLQFSLI